MVERKKNHLIIDFLLGFILNILKDDVKRENLLIQLMNI